MTALIISGFCKKHKQNLDIIFLFVYNDIIQQVLVLDNIRISQLLRKEVVFMTAPQQLFTSRVLLLTGHYGTGKTECAVNLALALAAAGIDLLKRREDHKIVIVFSDGLPNDMVSGRHRPGAPEKYIGNAAIQDTCFQVRKLRREGVHVIGIFLGDDNELENERMIYGASFLRIRRAEDFGGSAGKRLSETLLLL